MPIYLVMLAVLKIWMPVSWRFVLASLLFMANFSRLFGAPLNEYGSLWSLAVEEHFYLLWPTFVRHLRVQRLITILTSLLVAEPILRAITINLNPHVDIHYKTPFVLDYLAYGALLAVLIHAHRINHDNIRRIGLTLLAIGGSLTLVTIWLTAFHLTLTLDALFEVPFEWACCGVILLGLKGDHTRLVRTGRTDSKGLLPFFGYISYGLYLVNVFVFAKMGGYIDRHWTAGAAQSTLGFAAVKFFACVGLATLVAFLSREYFEAPILRLKDKWQERSVLLSSAKSKQVAADTAA